MIGLFIGRFQPFHKGHLWAIKEILKVCDKVIIGIGSSQYSKQSVNPYSADERRDMINACLKQNNISEYAIFEVTDIHNDDEWVSHVKKIVPKFDAVYSGSPLSKLLFTQEGYIVQNLPRYKNISASEVRLRAQKKMDWKELLDNTVVEIVTAIGIERLT